MVEVKLDTSTNKNYIVFNSNVLNSIKLIEEIVRCNNLNGVLSIRERIMKFDEKEQKEKPHRKRKYLSKIIPKWELWKLENYKEKVVITDRKKLC